MKRKKEKTASWRGIVRRAFVAALLIALGLSWPAVCSNRQALIESCYSETVYQSIRRAISAVTSLVPFSVAELLLYALILFSFGLTSHTWCCGQSAFRRKEFLKCLASLALTAGIILNCFT
jgi:hypothetical protein